jgi:adenylate cyclase
VVRRHGGIVDKLVGDEVVALFIGGIAGPEHAAAGISAGRDLLARCAASTRRRWARSRSAPRSTPARRTSGSSATSNGRWTSPLSATRSTRRPDSPRRPRPGELLISVDAARAAGVAAGALEARTLDVRGRTERVEVLVEPIAPG